MDTKYYIKRLSNGVRALIVPLKSTGLVHVEVKLLTGSDHETMKTLEYGHFLEHMNYRFTSAAYPDGKQNQKMLDSMGCTSNARIEEYITNYWAYGNSSDFMKIIDIVGHSFLDFKIDSALFKQEKNSVIEERKSWLNDQWYSLDQKMLECFYKKHVRSVHLRDIISNVKKTKISNLQSFRKKYYNNRKTLVIIAGDVSVKKVMQVLPRYFGKGTSKDKRIMSFPKFKYPNVRPIIKYVKNTKVSSTKIKIRFQIGITKFSKDYYLIKMIINLLSYGMSSRLIGKLRSDKGLIYYINIIDQIDYMNPEMSSIEIETETSDHNVKEFISCLLDELKNIKITDDEFKKILSTVKIEQKEDLIKNKLTLYTDWYSRGILFNGKVESLRRYYKKCLSVKKTDINRICNRIFKLNKMCLVYSGKQRHRIIEDLKIK